MASGTCLENACCRSAQDGAMRAFKYRTLVTVFVSAFLGALFYHLLYIQLTPRPSQLWTSETVNLNTKERSVQNELSGMNTRKFKAKIEEVNQDGWKKRKPSHYDHLGANQQLSLNHSQSGSFYITWPFHFPQPRYSKTSHELLHSTWITDLQEYLKTVEGKQISVVTSSIEHIDILFNWLVSAFLVADPPLENVLVLTLDKSLSDLAKRHGFSSLFVSPEMVIDPKAKITRVFSQVHIVRLAVVRLMNHYGYDVVNYDCDAILLKNPQIIFDSHKDADMIGTFGKGPYNLFMRWGVTLNTGVMLLRSNAKLESYWEAMSAMKDPTTDDQGNINRALETLKVKWMNLKPSQNIDHIEKDIFGVVSLKHPRPMKMIVMLMPFSTVCRQTCVPERRNEYFVWHAVAIKENRTVERKVSQAKVGSAWFLSEQWQTISEKNPTLQGVEWLRAVVDPELIQLIKHNPNGV